MTRYHKYVESLRREVSPEIFLNSSSEHAKIVLAELLKSAKNEVLIISRNLSSDITNDENYLAVLENFLERVPERTAENKPFQIILTDYNEQVFKASKVCQKLSKHDKKVALYKAEPELFLLHGSPVNFAVVDKQAYRFEYDIDKRAAVCSFYQTTEANGLAKIFREKAEGLTPISL